MGHHLGRPEGAHPPGLGTKESTDCCREFLEKMRRRGLPDPVLVATDGAPGLVRAVEECFFVSLRQRCLAHKVRNIVDKLPERARAEVKEAVHAAYRAPSLALARVNRDDVVARYEKRYPAAVRCFLEDFEACVAHLNLPPAHRRVCRTTNLLERFLVEERRHSRAAGTMLAWERAVMKLMFAALIRASESWRGIRISDFERRQLERLREQLAKAFKERQEPLVKESSAPSQSTAVRGLDRTPVPSSVGRNQTTWPSATSGSYSNPGPRFVISQPAIDLTFAGGTTVPPAPPAPSIIVEADAGAVLIAANTHASITALTARFMIRSRISRGYLARLSMTPSSQESEPPTNPARLIFRTCMAVVKALVHIYQRRSRVLLERGSSFKERLVCHQTTALGIFPIPRSPSPSPEGRPTRWSAHDPEAPIPDGQEAD